MLSKYGKSISYVPIKWYKFVKLWHVRKVSSRIRFRLFQTCTNKERKVNILPFLRKRNRHIWCSHCCKKKNKSISLSRYQPRNHNLPPTAHFDDCPREDMCFHPGHCPKIVNFLRYSFTKHVEKFSSRVRYESWENCALYIIMYRICSNYWYADQLAKLR